MKIIEPKIWVEEYDPVKIMKNLELVIFTLV